MQSVNEIRLQRREDTDGQMFQRNFAFISPDKDTY